MGCRLQWDVETNTFFPSRRLTEHMALDQRHYSIEAKYVEVAVDCVVTVTQQFAMEFVVDNWENRHVVDVRAMILKYPEDVVRLEAVCRHPVEKEWSLLETGGNGNVMEGLLKLRIKFQRVTGD
mmetsp:Transcript_63780/g.132828  ORF Transcript_63780/g.132828 Transcript_63780/m.132828 type:complete len:124 (+) Transcript_63780:171-542(+)